MSSGVWRMQTRQFAASRKRKLSCRWHLSTRWLHPLTMSVAWLGLHMNAAACSCNSCTVVWHPLKNAIRLNVDLSAVISRTPNLATLRQPAIGMRTRTSRCTKRKRSRERERELNDDMQPSHLTQLFYFLVSLYFFGWLLPWPHAKNKYSSYHWMMTMMMIHKPWGKLCQNVLPFG